MPLMDFKFFAKNTLHSPTAGILKPNVKPSNKYWASCVQLFMIPWTKARQVLLSSTASRSLVEFMLLASMTLSNHLVLCRPLLFLPSHFPNIRGFSRESSSHEMAIVLEPQLQDLSFQ